MFTLDFKLYMMILEAIRYNLESVGSSVVVWLGLALTVLEVDSFSLLTAL